MQLSYLFLTRNQIWQELRRTLRIRVLGEEAVSQQLGERATLAPLMACLSHRSPSTPEI